MFHETSKYDNTVVKYDNTVVNYDDTVVKCNVNNSYVLSKEELQEMLDKYLNMNDTRIPQGSLPWHTFKKRTIGGSEIGILTGSNKYQTEEVLVKRKLGLSLFPGTIETMWGNIFEEAICSCVDAFAGCYSCGTEAFLPGLIPEQTFSPDSIAVTSTDGFKSLFSPELFDEIDAEIMKWNLRVEDKIYLGKHGEKILRDITIRNNMIILYEYKCLAKRFPKKYAPPPYYVEQILLGLNTINICSMGVLCEGVFKICEWKNLNMTNVYNKCLDTAYTNINHEPLGYGIIGFYFNSELYHYKSYAHTRIYNQNTIYLSTDQAKAFDFFIAYLHNHDLSEEEPNDAGTFDRDGISLFIACFGLKMFIAKYSEPHVEKNKVYKTMNILNEYDKLCAEDFAFYLPWKLFKIEFHLVKRDVDFFENIKDKIVDVIGFVNKCNADPGNMDQMIQERYYTPPDENQFVDV